MRISSLTVSNFKALTRLELSGLQDTVVIAGPNGCGKSCLYDAIRLLKSAYGGYQPNEWHNWFGEFQINFNQSDSSWFVLFQDRAKSLDLAADFTLSDAERAFLRSDGERILTEQTWKEVAPELAGWRYMGAMPLATNLRVREPEVLKRVAQEWPLLLAELEKPIHKARLTITNGGKAQTIQSRVLELVFSQYDPHHLGIIDYHGATRHYGRERVGGINLNIEGSDERLRQHALYNYSNKYANLKTEMATSYVRYLLAKEANASVAPDTSLSETMKELFATFFPGKEFLGALPTEAGGMHFPVLTPSGAQHDIDDLSAGEKEVLYGYLRLRNSAPERSVLLIDEPELHLNPRLVSGLASFYHRHVGQALNNQLWLVTHSDTLIRDAVGQSGFSVFHLQPPGQYEGPNQASPVLVARDLDRLVIDLVGDLAAYRPGAKIVVFEGGGNSDFDAMMTGMLFPRFQSRINAISGGSKRRVADLYEVLERASAAGQIPGRFFAISDSDAEFDDVATAPEPTRFRWDAYHIENYLLEPSFVLSALRNTHPAGSEGLTEETVLAALSECARATIPTLVSHRLRTLANRDLVQSVNLSFDPTRRDVADALSEAVSRSRARIEEAVEQRLSRAVLREYEVAFTAEAEEQIESGLWRLRFRGRDVLKRFVGIHVPGISYEVFRNIVIAQMRDASYEPPGMARIVDAILKAPATP
jgi:hypothetical protein